MPLSRSSISFTCSTGGVEISLCFGFSSFSGFGLSFDCSDLITSVCLSLPVVFSLNGHCAANE